MAIFEDIEQVGVWQSELESLLLRLGERFHRREPRLRMRDYVRGLLGPVSRKNGWQLADAGHATPDGLQLIARTTARSSGENDSRISLKHGSSKSSPPLSVKRPGSRPLRRFWQPARGRARPGCHTEKQGTNPVRFS